MNQFDIANYPTSEPETFIAGDRVAWKRTDLGVDYPPALYSLSYSARLDSDAKIRINITATETGNDYIVEVSQATTAAWNPGIYRWQSYITRTSDSERVTVDSGTFEVIANRVLSTADTRSKAKIIVDAIEAVIARRATVDQEEYTINGRSLVRTSIPDLIVLRDKYMSILNSEINAERIRNGLKSKNHIAVRF